MSYCKICNYKARDSYNYNRHLKSDKHLERKEKTSECVHCSTIFYNKYSMLRHEKICKQKPVSIEVNSGSSCTNIANSSLNNISNSMNSTNVNINMPESSVNAKELESYMMEIKELIKNQLTDCFQKLVLSQMMAEESDIMDYLEEIDEEILKEWNKFREQHNNLCKLTRFVDVLDEHGNPVINKYGFADTETEVLGLSTRCFHHEAGFKLGIGHLNTILSKVLLNNKENLVVTHQTISLTGTVKLLFKHLKSLHNSGCVKTLLEKSKHVDKFCIKESDVNLSQEKYKELYSNLENLARKRIREARARR